MALNKEYLKNIDFKLSTVGFVVQDDMVLLGLRKKVSDGLGHNLISGIGGKVEIGETDEQGLIREFQEEVGIIPIRFKSFGRVKFIFPNKPKWCHSVAIFVIEEWEGNSIETDEIKPLWCNRDEIPYEKMWEDNSIWVPKILKGEQYNGIILYGEDGKIKEQMEVED